MLRRWATALLLASIVLRAGPSAAQEGARTSAREHFERGVEATRQNDLLGALEHFEKAHAQSPNQTVLYNLGQTYSALARAVDAVRVLKQYLDADQPPRDPVRRRDVEQLLRFNERRIGSLVASVDPADSTIEVDGVDVVPDASGRVSLVTGRHVVIATRSGYQPVTQRVDILGGAVTRVDLVLEQVVQAREASLEASCAIPDVAVSVDGVPIGRTPALPIVRIRSGEHSVRFERAGYQTVESKLTVAAGSLGHVRCGLVVDPALPPERRAELAIVVTEPGSRVLVDGSPFQKGPLPNGAHQIEVTKAGFEPYRRSIDARAGGRSVVHVVLQPTSERLRAERARTRRTWGYVTGGTGVVLVALAITLQVMNQGRYDDWQNDQLAFSRNLANGQASPGHAKRAADLQGRAADIQRTDDIALAAGLAGGVLLIVSSGLLFLGEGAEIAGAARSTLASPMGFSW